MAGIQLGGLFTGMDTSSLISRLMAIERGTINRYQLRQKVLSERQTALRDLETKLSALQEAAQSLSQASELRAFSTTSSNQEVLTAEASNSAFEGNHTVVVNQLANPERWVHTAGQAYAENYVGAGTFIYSYHHRETILTTTAETTLEDLVGLINNDANNPGVTANLLSYNNAYHLMLNGNEAGSDYAISINAANTEVWQAAASWTERGTNAGAASRIIDLEQFGGALAGDESILIRGKMHDGTVVNRSLVITKNTTLNQLIQEINSAFGGTATATLVNGQIRLTDHVSGASQMELSLTYDAGSGATVWDLPVLSQSVQGGSILAGLAGFGSVDFTRAQSAQDSQIKVDGYPAGAQEWITRSSNTVDGVLHGVTLRLHDEGTVRLDLARDTKPVQDRLNAVVTAYNAAVVFYKEKTGYNPTTKVAGVLMSDFVVSSLADTLRLSLLEQAHGFAAASDTFLMPGQIGLELDRDGKLSLNTETLNKAMADDYAGVLALIGAAKSGTSDSNTIQFYGASSEYTTAGTYNVEVTIADGVITSARIKRDTETSYRAATILGNTILGDSTFSDEGDPVYSENGLQLSVDRTVDGTFTATVRVQQGFAGAMVDALDRMVRADTGTLSLDRKHIEDQIRHLQDQITVEQDRLTRKQSVLVARFARLEKALSLLQNQMAGLGISTGSSP